MSRFAYEAVHNSKEVHILDHSQGSVSARKHGHPVSNPIAIVYDIGLAMQMVEMLNNNPNSYERKE